MKSKHDGWSARRRYKREDDRIARNHGYADDRSMRHARDIEELRNDIRQAFDKLFEHLPAGGDGESRLFETSVVAEAIGSTPKHVRWFAHTRQLESVTLKNEKARKLFFTARDVAKFLWSRRIAPGAEVLRTRIPANPRGVGGVGVTKKEAARSLEISTRAVERYLACGALKKSALSSKRMTLITSESVWVLAGWLVEQEDHAYGLSLKTLDRARKKLF